jgi:glycosyltransferase involved in cell wall biosynthesis
MEPVVTVITVVFQAEELIGRTMESVVRQTLPGIEHLVIDGASVDKTLEIVRSHSRPALRWISEPDHGIYDAMNKGLNLARGRYVIFMNAGDEFAADNVLEKVLGKNPLADYYFGNTIVVDLSGRVKGERRLVPPEHLDWKSMQYGMCVSHQSMIVRRDICPEYNLRYKISADIDWSIRVLKQAKSIVNSHECIARFLEGGVSSSRRKIALKERFAIFTNHYGFLRNIINHLWILVRFIIHRITRKSMT